MRTVIGLRATHLLVFLLPFTLCSPRPAAAEWPALGRVISQAPRDQLRPRVATDGAGGAIIVWEDLRSARVNVFARRVLASGESHPGWPVDGKALLTDSTALQGQQFPVIAPDGGGGAIVAWQDGRSIETGLDIFAQHILATGAVDPAWPANGLPLCTATGRQDGTAIVADGTGGAIVTWVDARSGVTGLDIFAQHVLASGDVDPRWPLNGVVLSRAPDAQTRPAIVSDGSGGAIVTWHDFRSSATSVDIYAQHVMAAGAVDPAWPVDGRALSIITGPQVNPTIVADGDHGAIVAWEDSRDGVSDIYAQRVLGSGVIAAGWPANGRAVCTAALDQAEPDVTGDGAGGAIIVWHDGRNNRDHDVFAAHVLAAGVIDPAWPANGRALSISTAHATNASIVEDGAGGAIVAWEEDFFVMAQHVQASGQINPSFPTNGRFMRLTLDFERLPDLVSTGTGNAIVAWSNRASSDFDIYAMIVVARGSLGVDPDAAGAGITFALPSPNPARAPFTLRFALPRPALIRLALYDVTGRMVREVAFGARPAGQHAVTWDLRNQRGEVVGAGLYFARLEAEGRTITHRVATLR